MPSSPGSVTATIVQALARKFVERAEGLGMKGKSRDDAALHYFIGAAMVAELTGDMNLARHIGMVAALIISVRGYSAVQDLADGGSRSPDQPA